MDILRFITAGSVDDGKSTLIGRLLYDTGNIKDDVLQSVGRPEDDAVNLAHITDGLRSEREQGITIDVAYKYFTTPSRKYIITDAPGHFQYTKNLVTGASNVDMIIMLIDANNGITGQTRRHSLVASFLKIPMVIVAINKMDAVGYSEAVFAGIRNDYMSMAEKLGLQHVTFVPVSALLGDNVISPSAAMKWYTGETLMWHLDNCQPADPGGEMVRFSAQCMLPSAGGIPTKGYAGKLLSGSLKAGDGVSISPGAKKAVVKEILRGSTSCPVATAGDNVTVYLEGDAAMVRGDLLHSHRDDIAPLVKDKFEATICWLDAQKPLIVNEEYMLRICTFETTCRITQVIHKVDFESLETYNDEAPVDANTFARVIIESGDMVAFDPYSVLKETGRGILVDRETNYTTAAFIIEDGQ